MPDILELQTLSSPQPILKESKVCAICSLLFLFSIGQNLQKSVATLSYKKSCFAKILIGSIKSRMFFCKTLY